LSERDGRTLEALGRFLRIADLGEAARKTELGPRLPLGIATQCSQDIDGGAVERLGLVARRLRAREANVLCAGQGRGGGGEPPVGGGCRAQAS
jgi:hypothetical protein